jgi:DNA-binding MarR family transcriptional regulator
MNYLEPNQIGEPRSSSQTEISFDAVWESGSISEVFQLVALAAKKLERIQRQTVKEVDLTPPQYFILSLLWQQDGRPFKDLAAALHSSRPTITGIVDTLEGKGLVVRRPNPDDRRSLLVTLTEEGKSLQHLSPNLETTYQYCCVGLEPEEFQQLRRLLGKLNDSLAC